MGNMGGSYSVLLRAFRVGHLCPCARSERRLFGSTQKVRDPVGDQGRERHDGDEHVQTQLHDSSPPVRHGVVLRM